MVRIQKYAETIYTGTMEPPVPWERSIDAWIEWGKCIKHEKQSDAVIALWDSVVQNGKKIGISGALLPEKRCYNKLEHFNPSSMS